MFYFFFKGFIYFEREKAQAGAGAGAEGEAGFLLSREPDAGLDPGILGSWPGPGADT